MITYLGSLVEGLSDEFKYYLVAGAVTGGGLTIIANAPNPAGAAILKSHFQDTDLSRFLFLGALVPTEYLVCVLYFYKDNKRWFVVFADKFGRANK